MKAAVRRHRTHNPFDETCWVSRLRENFTSGSDGEGLETERRRTLAGHEGGNPGYRQGQSCYALPRQSFTRQVTFEETRRHLGVETQRQWSDLAIARTTPVLFALYSLVCLIAYRLTDGGQIVPRAASWYLKQQTTFSDVLAYLRRIIWAEKYFTKSTFQGDWVLIQRHDWDEVIDQLAAVA